VKNLASLAMTPEMDAEGFESDVWSCLVMSGSLNRTLTEDAECNGTGRYANNLIYSNILFDYYILLIIELPI
jgi:hypothetical protein